MIEIFQILILFFIFSLFCFVPLNISGSKKFNKNKFSILDISTLLFILVAYIFRDFEIEYFVKTTLERIVFITSGFYVFIVINFLNSFKNN